jgi:hypothetical protein
MRTQTRWAAALFCYAAVLAGCGGSPASPAPPITYENLAGVWTGKVGGVSQGVTLDGTMSLNLQQSGGGLAGGYNVVATLKSGTQQSGLQGAVTLTGTVAPGPNPSVSFTTMSAICPGLPPENWSGSYGSGNGVLTITGTGNVISSACAIVLSFPQTILLSR